MAFNSLTNAVVLFCLITILGSEINAGKYNGELVSEHYPKMLICVFRHGARSPKELIPGDPNNDEWNEIGLQQLTDTGKLEQIQNGELTRQIYNTFIGADYIETEFNTQSRSYDRCLMSAQYFATGLFALCAQQTLQSECDQIQVTTVNTPDGNVNLIPIYVEMVPQILEVYEQYKTLIDAISNATGTKNPVTIYSYLDALWCEIYAGMTLPFNLGVYTDDILQLSDEFATIVTAGTYPVDSGFLLEDMLMRMNGFNNGSSTFKTNVYSMSDSNIGALMFALTNNSVGQPPFSSTIYLELYSADETVETDYFMLYYRPHPTSDEAPTAFPIINCGYKCPVEQFCVIADEVIALSKTLTD